MEPNSIDNRNGDPVTLTEAEKAVNHDTWQHIYQVQRMLLQCAADLGERCMTHDQSKLVPPEVSTFCEFTPKLKEAAYGSEMYKGFLRDMAPALAHHYANNSHHPEHFQEGIDGMDLLDVLEMLCDWIASGKRTKDGNIYKSLVIQEKRFGLSPQLLRIMRNTASWLAPDQADNTVPDVKPQMSDLQYHITDKQIGERCAAISHSDPYTARMLRLLAKEREDKEQPGF